MKAALIAAGRGARLRDGGITVPKPLVPIAGIPLIERVLGAVGAIGITEVACILNAEAEFDAVEAHCRRTIPHLHLDIVRRTTPSSMESLFALAALLRRDPFLLLTVDAIFGPQVLPALLQGLADHPDSDGVLAVHSYIDDEKPLRVRVDSSQRITAIGPDAGDSALITAGLYLFHPRIFDEIRRARANGYTALRQFLSHLCRHGYSLFATEVAKTIDVDRPQDIAVAEEFLQVGGRGSARFFVSPAQRGRIQEGAGVPREPKAPSVSPPLARARRVSRATRFLGVLREPLYSPGKVDADRAILESVAAQLDAQNDVRIISAADPLPADPAADVVFTMAQGPAALDHMRQWQTRGVRVINTPASIAGCHRAQMTAAFARAGVPHPTSILVRTDAPGALPEWITNGAWIKRGDVHATQPDDVVYADHDGAVAMTLTNFNARGIGAAIIQRHVPGSVFKFYAVRDTFFTCFASEPVDVALRDTAVGALRALAERGATALGLEIFGGDCVQQADGEPLLIDLNDWPSYGSCRLDAAHAIARYVATPR